MDRARPAAHPLGPGASGGDLQDLREARPDSPGLPIADALLAAGRGDEAAAREALSRVEPRYREALRADPDLGPLVR